jgi:hypothetical protein
VASSLCQSRIGGRIGSRRMTVWRVKINSGRPVIDWDGAKAYCRRHRVVGVGWGPEGLRDGATLDEVLDAIHAKTDPGWNPTGPRSSGAWPAMSTTATSYGRGMVAGRRSADRRSANGASQGSSSTAVLQGMQASTRHPLSHARGQERWVCGHEELQVLAMQGDDAVLGGVVGVAVVR